MILGLEHVRASLILAAVAAVACNDGQQSDGNADFTGGESGDDSGTASSVTTTASTSASTTASTTNGSTSDDPIFDVGSVDTSGTDTSLPPSCKVDDGELSGVGPCEDVAPPDSFEPDVQWSFLGPNGLTQCMTTPLVANMTDDNGDGEIDLCDVPDVVTVIGNQGETGPGNIVVLDGETGTMHFMIEQTVMLGATPALGDIDGDGLVEIVTVEPLGGGHIVAFEHDGTPKWTSSSTWAQSQTGSIALADLDSNVWDHQGQPIFTAPFDGVYSASTAADLDGDGDLEVLLGHAAYHHDGSAYWVKAEIQNLQFSITAYPQVANLDDDPQPEVLVAVENGIWLLEHDGTTVFSGFAPTGEGGDWNRPVNIHDFDGDNEAEFGISAYEHYGVYEVNQTPLFVADVIDFSGQAGGTAFDFLGSGIAQAIYADETTNWVFDIDGTVLMSTPRTSYTWTEYPSVADIDNDGSAEILVGAVGPDFTVQAIRDVRDRWIPARRIWNQHTYHVTNVREDGTIPQFEPPNWETLNTFRTQAQIAAGGGVCKPEPRG